jgi:hypothetical protein
MAIRVAIASDTDSLPSRTALGCERRAGAVVDNAPTLFEEQWHEQLYEMSLLIAVQEREQVMMIGMPSYRIVCCSRNGAAQKGPVGLSLNLPC